MTDLRRMKNILFDLDGTLLFTKPGIIHCMAHTMKTLGLPDVPDPVIDKCIGPPLTDSLLNRCNVPENRLDEALSIWRKEYDKKGYLMCDLYDGITELLEFLKGRGFYIYVATSKVEPAARAIIREKGIEDYFDDIAGSDPSTNVEEKVDVINSLFERNPLLSKEETFLLGDTFYDCEGANAAGIASAGALWGFGSKEELLEYGAKELFKSPAEMIDFFA